MQIPNIGVVYTDKIEDSFFDEFVSTLYQEDLDLQVIGRPEPGPFACAEWFIPTVVAVFISKPYFQSFLKEMGKDHYHLVKKGVSELCAKTVSSRRFEPVLMSSSGGKINEKNPYTLSFSILAESGSGYTFKLLIPKFGDDYNYQKATESFLDFVAEYHSEGDLSRAADIIKGTGMPGGTILVSYNTETSQIDWQDHLPPEIRKGMSVQQRKSADT